MSLLHKIALTLIPGVGSVNCRLLLKHFGTAEEVFKAKKSSLVSIPGIGEKTAQSILQHDFFDRAEQELAFVEKCFTLFNKFGPSKNRFFLIN